MYLKDTCNTLYHTNSKDEADLVSSSSSVMCENRSIDGGMSEIDTDTKDSGNNNSDEFQIQSDNNNDDIMEDGDMK